VRLHVRHLVPTTALQEWLGHTWPHTLSCSKVIYL